MIYKSLFEALDSAREQRDKLIEQRDLLSEEINLIRAKSENLRDAKELVRLINAEATQTLEMRLRLKAKIHKRVERINLDFDFDPQRGKVVFTEAIFINGISRRIMFFIDKNFAYIYYPEKGNNRKYRIDLTPEIHPKRKLTDEIARTVLRAWAEEDAKCKAGNRTPKFRKKLAAKLGISRATIKRIIHGTIFSWIYDELAAELNLGPRQYVRRSKSKYRKGQPLYV